MAMRPCTPSDSNTCTMEVTHCFEPHDAKEEKVTEFSNSAIVVVGTTGTGKSSLINLFCGNVAVIGHGVHSKTKDSHLFSETADKGRFWLDSQGANDSDGVDDEKVLTDALRKLYDQKIGNIKIIWCIEGGRFDKAKHEFTLQAKFIKILGNNAWNSTIIIQKGGRPNPKLIDGLLAAANAQGSDIHYGDRRLFGFTGTQYGNGKHLENDDQYQDWLEDFGDNQAKLNQKFAKFGYYTNRQIMDLVNQRLGTLHSLQITFTISKCTKCGVTGDTRFIFAPCHVAEEQHHPKEIENYHPGTYTSRMIHTGSHQRYTSHPGSYSQRQIGDGDNPRRRFHKGEWTYSYYHWGSDTREYHHSSGTVQYKYFLFASWQWGRKHKCCGDDEGSQGCCSRDYYTCCNQSSGSSGCSTKYYWSCCSNSNQNSDGCWMNYYTCCNRDGDECKTDYKWTCCDRDGAGCTKENYYTCCDKDADGCKTRYKCCEKEPNEEGCEKRCSNATCYKKWGTGPGCTKTYVSEK
eukprot:62137_1